MQILEQYDIPAPKRAGTPKQKINYRFNEDVLLKEMQEYIDSTYQGHYAEEDKIQTLEYIMDQCDTPDFIRGNILKYGARYGRKEGYNRKDVLKIIHYGLLMLYYHDSRFNITKEDAS